MNEWLNVIFPYCNNIHVYSVRGVLWGVLFVTQRAFVEVFQVVRYAAEHMQQLTSTDSFLELPPNMFQCIVSSDDLVFTSDGFVLGLVEQECLVFDIVLRYVDYNTQRVRLLPELLLHAVRLRQCNPDYLRSLCADERLREMSPESVAVLERALIGDTSHTYWTRPRNMSGSWTIL